MIPYHPFGHPRTTLECTECTRHAQELLPWRAPRGAAVPERLQPRKGPSLGQGGGRSIPEGLRGTDCSPIPTPVPHGAENLGVKEKEGTGKDPWVERRCCLNMCVCFTARIIFNFFFPLTVLGKGFSFRYLNGLRGNANISEKAHPKLLFCRKLRTGSPHFLLH